MDHFRCSAGGRGGTFGGGAKGAGGRGMVQRDCLSGAGGEYRSGARLVPIFCGRNGALCRNYMAGLDTGQKSAKARSNPS